MRHQSTPSITTCETALHVDTEIGQWATGDVDVWPAEKWPTWTDNFFWTPSEDDEAVKEAREATRGSTIEWEGTLEDDEDWLDSLEPDSGGLDSREIADCSSWDFGHPA